MIQVSFSWVGRNHKMMIINNNALLSLATLFRLEPSALLAYIHIYFSKRFDRVFNAM